jgi:hypothetical protein
MENTECINNNHAVDSMKRNFIFGSILCQNKPMMCHTVYCVNTAKKYKWVCWNEKDSTVAFETARVGDGLAITNDGIVSIKDGGVFLRLVEFNACDSTLPPGPVPMYENCKSANQTAVVAILDNLFSSVVITNLVNYVGTLPVEVQTKINENNILQLNYNSNNLMNCFIVLFIKVSGNFITLIPLSDEHYLYIDSLNSTPGHILSTDKYGYTSFDSNWLDSQLINIRFMRISTYITEYEKDPNPYNIFLNDGNYVKISDRILLPIKNSSSLKISVYNWRSTGYLSILPNL